MGIEAIRGDYGVTTTHDDDGTVEIEVYADRPLTVDEARILHGMLTNAIYDAESRRKGDGTA